ncbi:primosomal protein N' [Thiosocius teredinicola]|uniref:primosomal protein N' n=1 Tax=Thiosocius teredinicola TaxID=1973002 RepID=UPI000990F951
MKSMPIARIAVGAPLRSLFDYAIPPGAQPAPGARVAVSFGRAKAVGVVVELLGETDCPHDRLKPLSRVIDPEPLLADDDLAFLRWVADYYHHPIGEVVLTALPRRLRSAVATLEAGEPMWELTDAGRAFLQSSAGRAPRQREILDWLQRQTAHIAPQQQLKSIFSGSHAVFKTLCDKGLIASGMRLAATPLAIDSDDGHELNAEQAKAYESVAGKLGEFAVALLDGVTGSGKTEVYLQLATAVLASGKSVLVLVPEISLTPQLYERFRQRLGDTVQMTHSAMTDNEREHAWHRARLGLSRVLLGTRSSIFTPIADLGLVIVDEEHDPSFKQTEGFRYSARDLAIVRGQRAQCPVVLGSATPSLESLRNVQADRYRHLRLDQRAGNAQPPRIDLLDVRDQPLQCGVSAPLLERVDAVLARGEQVMLFLNRRGYAPVLTCFSCGWLSDCPRCDARQTVHRASGLLWCHHCGAQRRVPSVCPECGEDDLHPLGQGTEQLEGYLAERYAQYPLIRVDRDATARKGSLDALLQRLHDADAAILVGTQMLAKGHHFPRVTLVGVLDADGGLYSADFRSTERMAQLLIQVAGRAGRGDRPGQVLIQTRFPEHPLLQTLVRHGYRAFAEQALQERQSASMPPYSHQALLRAEASRRDAAETFLAEVAAWASQVASSEVALWGPVPAPMARRAGKHRVHLLLQAAQRNALHAVLRALPEFAAGLPVAKRVRWHLDIDPIDLY